MSVSLAIVYVFEILAALSALSILFTKNVFHAAILLMVCMLSLAGVYVLYNAEFIAVTQILIYAGGVLVLILFAIMLTSRLAGKPLLVKNQYVLVATLIGVCIAAGLTMLFYQHPFYHAPYAHIHSGNPIHHMGIGLMGEYVLPFEAAGILLLIVLVGAAVTISSIHTKKP